MPCLRNRELPGRHIREQLERVLEVAAAEVEDLRVMELEDARELVLVADADDPVEAELDHVRGRVVEAVALVPRELGGHDQISVGAGARGGIDAPAAPPEDRQLGRLPHTRGVPGHDERLRAVRLRRMRCVRRLDLDDHRDSVAFGDRLAESSAAPFPQGRHRNPALRRAGTVIPCASAR